MFIEIFKITQGMKKWNHSNDHKRQIMNDDYENFSVNLIVQSENQPSTDASKNMFEI